MNATAFLIEKGAQVLLEQLRELTAENERLREQLSKQEAVDD